MAAGLNCPDTPAPSWMSATDYIEYMSEHADSPTAARIRKMASERQVAYVRTERDLLARHVTRLAGDDIELDEIEQLLIALQRSGHLSRAEMIQLQADYLREVRP
jgi:hypothetical protein